MTPEQRAERIVFTIFHEPQEEHFVYEHLVAAQIREAVEEAKLEAYSQGWKEAKEDAWVKWQKDVADAYEDAARIIERNPAPLYASISDALEDVIDKIRARAKELK